MPLLFDIKHTSLIASPEQILSAYIQRNVKEIYIHVASYTVQLLQISSSDPGMKPRYHLIISPQDFHRLLITYKSIQPLYCILKTLPATEIITRPSTPKGAALSFLFLSQPVHFAQNSSEALGRIMHRHRPGSARCHARRQRHLLQSKRHRSPLSIG